MDKQHIDYKFEVTTGNHGREESPKVRCTTRFSRRQVARVNSVFCVCL